MPAILLFAKQNPTVTVEALLDFIGEELGFDAGVSDVEQVPKTGAIREATFTMTSEDEEEEGGSAVVSVTKPGERSEDIAALLAEVLEQAPELKDVLTGNKADITVRFDDGDQDDFAGCMLAYALSSLTECGMLVVGMPISGGCGHDHEDGEECDHEHDEDSEEEATLWFNDAEEFAEVFFVHEEDGEDSDDDDDEDDKR